MDDGNSDKKAKGTKKCVIEKMIKFSDYKNCLLDNEIMLKLQQRFKVKHIVHIQKKSTRLH